MLSRLRPVGTVALAALAAVALAGCDRSDYRRSGDQWTHGDIQFTPEHPASFTPLDQRFARDQVRGYCRGTVIADSDGASFAVVSETEAKDGNSVYLCDTHRQAQEYWSVRHLRIVRIEGADAATYVSLGKGYARDKHRVYLEGQPFQVRDPATFQPLEGDFARDSQRGYYARLEILGSHGPSFEVVDAHETAYARDRANGYYGYRDRERADASGAPRPAVRTLRDVEAAALRVLGRDYVADGRHVWYQGRPVVGADPASFAVDTTGQEGVDARDKTGTWLAGRRVEPVK